MSTSTEPAPVPRSVNAVLVAGVTGLAIGMLSVMIWLFGPTPAQPQVPVDVNALPSIDGVFLEVDPPRLVLKPYRPLDGKAEISFTIREADRENFDVAHLRSHASIGLPSRLYYERDGDTFYAIYKEDAPANSSRQRRP